MSDAADRDLIAAEHVLGTLEGEEARAAEQLLATDATFAAAVRRWEERLMPLAACAPPVAPPAGLWDRIDVATASGGASAVPVGVATTPATVAASSAVGATSPAAEMGTKTAPPAAGAASAMAAAAADVVPLGLRRRLRVWQASTGAALAIAASLAAVVVHRSPPRVAVLAPMTDGVPVLLATTRSNGVTSIQPDGTITVPGDHDLELWALGAGETRPRSLGVLPASGRQLAVALPAGTQLLVSLEPRGGSPTGQPTGPVLYGGQLTALE
ncbi:anti-sigma factor [Rhodopila sp.]|uniref:anti-sigma factor n=1 Tax=Rhodopila sp. TaxID=2480087 RepID=UPI003D0B7169